MGKWLCHILLCVHFFGVAQTNQDEIDSLEILIKETRKDVSRVDLANKLALLYYNIDIKKSLSYGEDALELATELEYDHGIKDAHSILRRVHRRLGNYTAAIEYTLKNLPLSEQLKDSVELLDSYLTLGNVNSSMGNYPEALPYLFKAFTIGKILNAPQLANIQNFIGRTYGKIGRYDSALYYIQQALLEELAHPQPGYGLSYIYNNLAEIYYYKKEYNKAIEFYNLSASLAEEKRSLFGMTYTLNGLALIYKAIGQHDKAIEYALQSIEISRENNFRDKTKEAYGILYEIYYAQNNFKKALEFYQMFNLYQDSIYSEDRMQYIENLKINYETERIKKENELLKKDTELKAYQLNQQITLAWVAVVTIALLLLISALLYWLNRQRRKTNSILKGYNQDLEVQVKQRTQELVDTNLELINQNKQLEQFGYITAHNLRAPVARILGLTDIIQSGHFSMPHDKDILNKLHFASKELDAIIHDLTNILDIKKGVLSNYEKVNLKERIQKVKNILSEKIKESNAVIEEDLAEAPVCFAIPAYIESILFNIISNSIKYRSSERSLKITVSSKLANDSIHLQLSDNGIGMDLSKQKEKVFRLYQRFHSHVEGKGIGLYLVKTQVEAMNGSIDISSEINKGTVFKIILPHITE